MIFTCFGDMMRVPGCDGSLLEAKAEGADVRMVYSPLDALRIARENPDREVVFFAIGFETTAPSTALTLCRARRRRRSRNFTVLCNHVTIVPPVRALLDSPDLRLDGFIGPGHVSTVVGARPFEFIPADYGKPVVVSGFEPLDLLQSVFMCCASSPRGAARSRTSTGASCPWEGNRRALESHGPGLRAAPALRVARPRLHLPERPEAVRRLRATSTPRCASPCRACASPTPRRASAARC